MDEVYRNIVARRRHNRRDAMSHFRTVLVLGFAAALALIPAVSSRPVVTLSCSTLKQTPRILHVVFAGESSLPDAALLRFRVDRLEEADRQGMLEKTPVRAGAGTVESTGGLFSFDQILRGPGTYRVVLELPEMKAWEFDFDLWGDDFPSGLSKQRRDVETMVWALTRLTVRASIMSSDPRTWNTKGFVLLDEMEEAAGRLDESFAPLFPAAREHLRRAIAGLRDASRHFFWDRDGKFGGAFDPSTETWMKGPDGARFTFGRTLSFIDAGRGIARREHDLWIVKDARRTVRTAPRLRRRPETRTLLADMEGTLDRIEAAVRAGGRAAEAEILPPTPPQFLEAALQRERIREAQRILVEADRLWDQLNDNKAPTLYRQLLSDFPDLLTGLGARARVANRAKSE
jgi:hypothetical protein